MCDSLREPLLCCADFIFNNEEKKAPDGKMNLMTYMQRPRRWGWFSPNNMLAFVCPCAWVCCFIDLFITPKDISAEFHLLLQFPHKGRQDTDNGAHTHSCRHAHFITMVLSARMQGPNTNVAQGTFHIILITSSPPVQLETLVLSPALTQLLFFVFVCVGCIWWEGKKSPKLLWILSIRCVKSHFQNLLQEVSLVCRFHSRKAADTSNCKSLCQKATWYGMTVVFSVVVSKENKPLSYIVAMLVAVHNIVAQCKKQHLLQMSQDKWGQWGFSRKSIVF